MADNNLALLIPAFEKTGRSLIARSKRMKIIKYLAHNDNAGKDFLYKVFQNGGKFVTSEVDLKNKYPGDRLETILAYVQTIDTGCLYIASIPSEVFQYMIFYNYVKKYQKYNKGELNG